MFQLLTKFGFHRRIVVLFAGLVSGGLLHMAVADAANVVTHPDGKCRSVGMNPQIFHECDEGEICCVANYIKNGEWTLQETCCPSGTTCDLPSGPNSEGDWIPLCNDGGGGGGCGGCDDPGIIE